MTMIFIVFALNIQDWIGGINHVFSIERQLIKKYPEKSKIKKRMDIIGLFACNLVISCGAGTLLVIPLVIYSRFDYIGYILDDIFLNIAIDYIDLVYSPVKYVTVSISVATGEMPEFILPHFNWLTEYENCFNFIYAFAGITYYANIENKISLKNAVEVPIVYYQNLTTFVPLVFQRWTECQTISLVIHFNLFPTVRDTSYHISDIYAYLGFKRAYDCLTYGHYCELETKSLSNYEPLDNYKRVVGMHPLTIFYILPRSDDVQDQFRQLDFMKIYYNPFLQIPYRITYPVQFTNTNNKRSEFILGEKCHQITFMCKFCNVSSEDFYTYYFSDIHTSCQQLGESSISRQTFESIFMDATGNGKKLTYFKLPSLEDFKLMETDWEHLRNIQTAKSLSKVLWLKPRVDEIMLSILLETMQEPSTDIDWQRSRWGPGVGATPLMNLIIGNIKLDTMSFNFVTCGNKLNSLDLLIYLHSFDTITWLILILVVYISVYMVRSIRKTYKEGLETIHHDSDSLLLAIYAFLLNTSVSTRELRKNNKLRRFFVVWLLTSIIISNSYKGENISKATEPMQFQKLEKILDLKRFQLFAKAINTDEYFGFSFHSRYRSTDFGSELSGHLHDILGNSNFSPMITSAWNQISLENKSSLDNDSDSAYKWNQDIMDLAKMLLELHRLPFNITSNKSVLEVGTLIGKCNKTAFIGRQDEVNEIVKNLEGDCNTLIYTGKDRFLEKTATWFVQENGGCYIKDRLSYLGESGIYTFWKQLIDRSRKDSGKNLCSRNAIPSISLQSNIRVIFYAVSCLYVIISVAFGLELLGVLKST
ncbi:unnamed protein product [Orchesella dallaii]|uniref:Uncharacterized protein n=1 Tax=Orchesella dallaii TaxID=48710 RepID=A0ABP1SAF7_9HEXA